MAFSRVREIIGTDAGLALKSQPMQEIQCFIMRFMELLTEQNTFAIDFLANPIAQVQVQDYKARTLYAPEEKDTQRYYRPKS
ncbi:MAG: hypothetical protein EZS28_011542 [Streblomastix strix]|uniref:Uncharacterized protein n=1 Tax=Streblomastix strix TaxID=222440 RepID=A0A5J4WDC2_9EUKA|nr:MAG: hypothetical protein EZS28_011542 [Streblomastix strix]